MIGHCGSPRVRCIVAGVKRERLTVAEAAEVAGVRPSTWRSYVARGQAPAADGAFDRRTPWWWSTTVRAWVDASPGRGVKRSA
jgi:hypothetical protein